MDALFYEYLIRRVFNCGRTSKNGANADIFRKMERSFHSIETSYMLGSKEDKEYTFRGNFAEVREYVSWALLKSLNRISGEAAAKIKELLSELNMDFYDKERLEEIIKEANDIFIREGLVPG